MTNEKSRKSLKGFMKPTITELPRQTEGDIVHHEDARIDAHQDVHAGDGIEELENIKKELPLGKIN